MSEEQSEWPREDEMRSVISRLKVGALLVLLDLEAGRVRDWNGGTLRSLHPHLIEGNRNGLHLTPWGRELVACFYRTARLGGDLREMLKESERIADLYREEIHKVHVALDIRCVDDPSKVGCEDMVFETHKVAAAIREKAEAFDALALAHRPDTE